MSSNALPSDQDVLLESEDAAEVEAGASAVEVRELKAGHRAAWLLRLDENPGGSGAGVFSGSYSQQLLEQGAVSAHITRQPSRRLPKVKLAV